MEQNELKMIYEAILCKQVEISRSLDWRNSILEKDCEMNNSDMKAKALQLEAVYEEYLLLAVKILKEME